jgi:hypothetical protein
VRRLLFFTAVLLSPLAARGDDPVVDLAARVPAGWLGDEADDMPLPSPRWMRRLPEQCHTRRGYREHCQGPRDVPEPHGPAAERAARLALGQRATALQLMHGEAFPEWKAVVRGMDPRRRLHFPVPDGRIGRLFGRTRTGSLAHRRHLGVDIAAPEGDTILAARGGLVVYSDNGLTGYGNAVMLLHDHDETTFYAHCSRTLVFAGQLVTRGEPIAEVGRTGFAYVPHLHFEFRRQGYSLDPIAQMDDPRIRRHGAPAAPAAPAVP